MPVQRLRLGAARELERSQRAFRLLYANWLAQVDRPAGRRAPLAIWSPLLDLCRRPVRSGRGPRREPEFLAEVLDRLEVTGIWFAASPTPGTTHAVRPERAAPWDGEGGLARERRRRSALIVRLAAEVYHRERGAAPATAGSLLGTVLEELPEGIAAADPIPAGPE